MDLDVLECTNCFKSLVPPIFQCKNGHITCSSCCKEMRNICHLCNSTTGKIRCLGLEKVIESLKIPCKYFHNGCQEKISFANGHSHIESCLYSPLRCPILDCTFNCPVLELSVHINNAHKDAKIKSFKYGKPVGFWIEKSLSKQCLQGEDGPLLLILSHYISSTGVSVVVCCINPKFMREHYTYKITVKENGFNLHTDGPIKNVRSWESVNLMKDNMLIPLNMFRQDSVILVMYVMKATT